MLYTAIAFSALLGGAEAWSAGFTARSSTTVRSRPAARMQVAEADVASPVALAKAADEARGLAIDSIARAESGHMGLPLGCAEIGAVLFGQEMSYNPADPEWINRDRFVLSAGHGSMFLYSWLHMAGYDLPMDEVAAFRAKDSKTPGHPEFGWTPGVEATTGPLGQGIGNGVGMAAAAKLAAATLNTPEHTIIDHHVVVLCGDGCLQEGIANEAAAFAGHEKLDNLILMYDSNGVTLDKMAEHTQSEDIQMRFEAQGWEVLTVDGHDVDAITKAYRYAKDSDNGKPTMIICKTIIGKGIDEIAGTCAAHGEAGVQYADSARESLGLPTDKWCAREFPAPIPLPAQSRIPPTPHSALPYHSHFTLSPDPATPSHSHLIPPPHPNSNPSHHPSHTHAHARESMHAGTFLPRPTPSSTRTRPSLRPSTVTGSRPTTPGSQPTPIARSPFRTPSTASCPTLMPPSRPSLLAAASPRAMPARMSFSRLRRACPSTSPARPTCTAPTRTT